MGETSDMKRDLIVLVSDRNMEHTLRQVFERHPSLKIRPIDFDIVVYVGKADPGCCAQSHNFLRLYERDFQHALVLFDHQGSGRECGSVEEVEKEVSERLRQSGWGERAATIVIVPELEAWVWGPSIQVERTLGWRNRPANLRQWLQDKGLWPEQSVKPPDPKRALETTLSELKRPRSSSIYAELASKVSLRDCRDRSFCRLVQILRSWFPASDLAQ